MPNVVDLFCGCGGLSLGFQEAGYDVVRAFDNWEIAVNTYNNNFNHPAELLDVYAITADYLRTFNPDVVIGGPPCQDYSSAGLQDETQGRADLTRRYAEIIAELQPRWFVMENVDRILKSKTLPVAIDIFRNAGYGLSQVVLDASRCGVPQARKRFFMIGELNGQDDFITQALIDGQSQNRMTVREYMGDELDTDFYYRHPRSYARRGIFSIDEPSPTIRGVNRPIPPAYQLHPGDATQDINQVRPLTTLERARIQTFPREFVFEGKRADMEQMIGNAVPVQLSAYVGRHLLEYINAVEQE